MNKRSLLGAVVWVGIGFGCVGNISQPGGGSGGNAVGGGPTPADKTMMQANADLFAVASTYFPSTAAAMPSKRMARLTRTQLDLTTKTLLPAHVATAAMTALPPDPLQTNYEYAANLAFTPANFTPYTKWVDGITASVRANPASVIDCAASGNSTACLQTEAKKFAARAFRGTLSDAQLARYADMLTTGVSQVGLPDAVADLVDVTLNSPNYVYRDEVLTDASAVLLPAERLQAVSYTLADAPPETVGLSSAAPTSALATSDAMAATVDKLLATPEARAKLMRFFISWLEVREPDRVHDRADGVSRVHAGARRRDGRRGQGVPERAALQGGAHAEGRDPVDAVVRLGRAVVDLRRGRVGRDQADVAGPEAAARDLHASGA